MEDDADNLLVAKKRLAHHGCAYRTAGTGEEAIAAARADPAPALLLTDIQLPRMRGWEAASRIKRESKRGGVPIVALTAKAMKGDREAILAVGCDDCLAKPVDLEELGKTRRAWMT